MNQRVVKKLVVIVTLLCFFSLWYLERTTRELSQIAENHLMLITQMTQLSANSSQMINELRQQNNELLLFDDEQSFFLEKHQKLISQSRDIFDSIQFLDPQIEIETLVLRKDFEKINIEWLNANRDQINYLNPAEAIPLQKIYGLYLRLNDRLKSLSDMAVSDVYQAIKKIQTTVTDLHRLMIMIQLFATAMMLGLFHIRPKSFIPKDRF